MVPDLGQNDTIKYLGVSYNDESVFDSNKTMQSLRSQLELLATSPLLQPHQKFHVISSFICPQLVYPFQATSPRKIPLKFLKDADVLIKSSIKDILQLPGDIPDNMIYTENKFKGLGIFRACWEIHLQHINTCAKLNSQGNLYISSTRNLLEETDQCLKSLQVDKTEAICSTNGLVSARKVRAKLRRREYSSWCNLSQKGKGVILYSEFTPANSWINKFDGLTNGEWKEALKMTANVSAVRAIPGRSQDNHCRRCLSEIETLGHVLGACPYGETLRLHRHHAVRTKLSEMLRSLQYIVHEEVHGSSSNGSNRRIDIIAFKEFESHGMIIDPTVRFELHQEQPREVHAEKQAIYIPTVPYYKEKYKLDTITVTGLMFGARGTIPKFTHLFCKGLGIPNSFLKDLAVNILKDSIKILKNHLYGI